MPSSSDPKLPIDRQKPSVWPRIFIVVCRPNSRSAAGSKTRRGKRLELWATILKILAALAALFRALR
jgi:hypothetical protein